MPTWEDILGPLVNMSPENLQTVTNVAKKANTAAGNVTKGVEQTGGGQAFEMATTGGAPAMFAENAEDTRPAAAPAKTDAPKKSDKKAEAPASAPATQESDYEALANAQAEQYLSMTKALDPLTSGASLPAVNETMASNAGQMLGQSSASPVDQWLNQQTKAAAAQYAPVAAANAQVGAAEDNASSLIASGLQNMGVAESDLMNAAPYQQLLSSLASEVPYHLASGYTIPGLTTADQPKWLQQAETNAGVTPTVATGGSTSAAKGLLPAPTTGIIPSPAVTSPETSATPQGG